jgi:hypothetical protein
MTGGSPRIFLQNVDSSEVGFSRLADLHATLSQHSFEAIKIDFSSCLWFDANMSAPLGVVLAHAVDNLNTIEIANLDRAIETILCKNQFLAGFGFARRRDTYGTAIPYRRFKTSEDRRFAEYLNDHLHGKDMPQMSDALSEQFSNSMLELFANAAMHSETVPGIFACGQFFPRKHRVDFSVADAGIGMRRKIAKELGIKMNSDMAIAWALQEGHTTRKGKVPGGLGLKLIREFINMNQGRIQVVSDRGFWELSAGQETLTRMQCGFPGTVINIEINTSDTASYRLSGEA